MPSSAIGNSGSRGGEVVFGRAEPTARTDRSTEGADVAELVAGATVEGIPAGRRAVEMAARTVAHGDCRAARDPKMTVRRPAAARSPEAG